MQVFERIGIGCEVAIFQKRPHADFNFGRIPQRAVLRTPFAQRFHQRVAVGIFRYQLVDISIGNLIDNRYQIADAVRIHRHAEGHFSGYFIAIRYGYLPHVIAEANHFHRLQFVGRYSNPAPVGNFFQHIVLLPVANHDFPIQPHSRHHKPKLPVAVSRLVEVHEVHVDGTPGNVAVKLGMEMEQWLFEHG